MERDAQSGVQTLALHDLTLDVPAPLLIAGPEERSTVVHIGDPRGRHR